MQTKVDFFNAGKKNLGGAAYNLISMGYEPNQRGNLLHKQDEESNVRAVYRASNLQ